MWISRKKHLQLESKVSLLEKAVRDMGYKLESVNRETQWREVNSISLMASAYGYDIATRTPLRNVVAEIVRHLGLTVRLTPASLAAVELEPIQSKKK
jgi:hypothetical protein